jgi:hypothetical protein
MLHNVAARLALLLTTAGHPTRIAAHEGRAAASDPEHLLHATVHSWTLVTHNRTDVRLLHIAWRRFSAALGIAVPHAGILILEQRGVLAEVLNAFPAADPPRIDRLWEWSRHTGWREGGD